jgi:hypothetical protein
MDRCSDVQPTPCRLTTDEVARLDIRALHRVGALTPGYRGFLRWSSGVPAMSPSRFEVGRDLLCLTYAERSGAGLGALTVSIAIERSGCRFGGTRAWFRCPNPGCDRRVAVLYAWPVFACRHCQNLVYASTREPSFDRALRRAERIRRRLGWDRGILNSAGTKPKWMRWKTFTRLAGEHDRHARTSLDLLMETISGGASGVGR